MPVALATLLAAVAWGLWRVEMLGTGLLWHAALMTTAWAGLLPAGALVARYAKVTKRQRFPAELDNPTWWRWHQALQYTGVTFSTLGFAIILRETGGDFRTLHGQLGLVVVVLGWAQVAAGLLRGSKGGPTDPAADPARPETWRGDHFDMTPRRVAFERFHKTCGWLTLLLAAAVIVLGVGLLGTPDWLMLLVGLVFVALVVGAADAARARRWVDTYVAIWGPILRSPRLGGRPGKAGEGPA